MKHLSYYKQAELLLRILPLINSEKVFALKGGSAINFFIRDLPRLSVDIDLTYLFVKDRSQSLSAISDSLINISEKIRRMLPGCSIHSRKIKQTDFTGKLIVKWNRETIKIEPNYLIRGTVFDTEIKSLSKKTEELFETSMNIQLLSMEELYAGKICAGLDRQHPRDLFDIKILLENEGLTEKIRKAFIVYLISHNRPMVELLDSQLKEDIRGNFKREFEGMTSEPVEYDELVAAKDELMRLIRKALTIEERQFILSVKKRTPEWGLLGLEGIEKLPAVKWKLKNLNNFHRVNRTKYKNAVAKLQTWLEV